MGGWLNMWYIHAVEYYSAIKMISHMSNNLDDSPENDAEWKVNPTGLRAVQFHLYNILKCKRLEMENRLEVAREEGVTQGILMTETFCVLTVSMSKSWLGYGMVLQDITLGGSWVKGRQDVFVLFLKTAWESTISSITSESIIILELKV